MTESPVQTERYQIRKEIETNRFFSVHRGVDTQTGVPVMIKEINTVGISRTELIIFREDYKKIRRIDSAGLLKVLDFIEDTDKISIICSDIPGKGISYPVPLKKFLNYGIQLADILISFHTAKVLHGNICLSGIIEDDGHIYLMNPLAELSVNRHDESIYDPYILARRIPYISPEQSGRMNRSIDYRSDFYSLGMVFYQMITGRVPFVYSDSAHADPLEVFHAHIAVTPDSPSVIGSGIPRVVSDIVMKLISKNAEDRYQSAAGLKYDLEECARLLDDSGKVQTFQIASRDTSSGFRIVEKLYGRENELGALLSIFEKVCAGSSELAFVAGYSGIGKTTLISEIYKPVVYHRGYFISGKFDQYMKDTPYSAFIQALQMLIRHIAAEDETRIARWKNNILESLGNNGRVVIDVIPELALITGQQPPVIELAPAESQNRFNLYFQRFIRVFCSDAHPLTIFLDDLQWADLASLGLIKNLICDSESRHLFLLGAYRDNEVSPIHPLMLMLDELAAKESKETVSITLGPITAEQTDELIRDTLKTLPEESAELSRLVYGKTLGNPFFIKEFLKTLHREGLIWLE
jgi:hypothetical protein